MSVFDDDLTPADMAFLQKFNKLGRSDTADSEYNPEQEFEDGEAQGGDAEGSGDNVLVEESDTGGEGESEFPSDDDRRTNIEGEEKSESEIDDSKMDISNVETGDPDSTRESSDEAEEKDYLENGDSDSEIQDGESDLEFDDLDGHVDDDKMADSDEAPDPELVEDDAAELEVYEDENADEEIESDPDPDMDFDKDGEETHYDEAQVEEDDGEGERANSDEARESDEPIGGDDSESDDDFEDAMSEGNDPDQKLEDAMNNEPDSDPDDKGMTEAEAEEIIEQELNAQEGSDDFEGDAQQELEDHLRNNESEQENEGEGRSQQGQGEGNGDFSDLPGGIPNCDDHCEDNEASEGDHECPRCAERIMRERKLWGVIATDMNGADIYPGDKVRVEIPMSFFTAGAILTANVPNSQMDRVATKTNGEENPEALWLSGARISQFTGYNHNGHPVWTFEKGRVLRFAIKVGEPIREGGGQLDIEDMIEELNQDLDNLDQGKDDLEENQNQEEDLHEDSEPEPEEEGDDEDYDEDGKIGPLSKTQMKRFENLFERIEKKVIGTFGSTAEVVEHGEIYTNEDGRIARPVTIKSRGVTYTIVLVAHRGS